MLGLGAGLTALRIGLDASMWILTPFALAALPAVWDLVADPRACLAVTDDLLVWRAGSRGDQVRVDDIDRVRIDTQWDFSIRTTISLRDGLKLKVPPPCQPPSATFEAVLTDRGVSVERHHFTKG